MCWWEREESRMYFLNSICVMGSLGGVRSFSHLRGFHEEAMTPSGGLWCFASRPWSEW